jgi:antitoxin HicB
MSELKTYLELPYTVFLRRDNEGDFVAKIDELPGCAAHGKTREEALVNLDEAKALWIEDCLENGDAVPQPAEDEALPSGKWLQRVPRNLHRKLQTQARKEGVSFNQYVTAILAEAVGGRMAIRAGQPPGHAEPTPSSFDIRGYFLGGNSEPLPGDFQLVDVSFSGRHMSGSLLLESLSRLSAQLPDKIELKSKAIKDENKRHTPFAIF